MKFIQGNLSELELELWNEQNKEAKEIKKRCKEGQQEYWSGRNCRVYWKEQHKDWWYFQLEQTWRKIDKD